MAVSSAVAMAPSSSRPSLASSSRIGSMTLARRRVERSSRPALELANCAMRDDGALSRFAWRGSSWRIGRGDGVTSVVKSERGEVLGARRIGRGDGAIGTVKSDVLDGALSRFERRGARSGNGAISAVKSDRGEVLDSGDGGDGGPGGSSLGWISSALVFAFFGAFVAYAAFVAPGQTPYRDQYFIEKLVGLRSGDGFMINTILWCEFFIMGLWPVIYCALVLPSGRSKNLPAWPFLIVSFAVGAFALLPYFAFWQPPPPKVKRQELQSFPLNVLENKLVAVGVLLSGTALLVAAALAGGDQWTEMYQYFRESKFIHVMSIDFFTLSALAPFWVYNDMATRKWLEKGKWLLPLTLVPYVGPGLYLCLRPSLPESILEEKR